MNRDTEPGPGWAAVVMMDLLITGKQVMAAQRAGTSAADAAESVRKVIGHLWPQVVPEAARDVLVTCAEIAHGLGVTELPADVVERFGARALDGAAGMLEMTAKWVGDGRPAPTNGPFTPPLAFASSIAFDREEDVWTLASVAVLLSLAHPQAGPPPPACAAPVMSGECQAQLAELAAAMDLLRWLCGDNRYRMERAAAEFGQSPPGLLASRVLIETGTPR